MSTDNKRPQINYAVRNKTTGLWRSNGSMTKRLARADLYCYLMDARYYECATTEVVEIELVERGVYQPNRRAEK